MQLREVELSKFQQTNRRWGGSEPYTICFVYTQDGDNFVLKGMCDLIEAYLENLAEEKNFLYCKTFWRDGQCRTHWRFESKKDGIKRSVLHTQIARTKNDYDEYGYVYRGRMRYSIKIGEKGFTLRRMPKKWIPEFDGI